MRKKTYLIFSFFLSFGSVGMANCNAKDQTKNMCKGNGFCTSYPIGKEGETCGKSDWTIPDNWAAMDVDCLTNVQKKGAYSCKNSGKVKIVICGKGNCYQCLCN